MVSQLTMTGARIYFFVKPMVPLDCLSQNQVQFSFGGGGGILQTDYQLR